MTVVSFPSVETPTIGDVLTPEESPVLVEIVTPPVGDTLKVVAYHDIPMIAATCHTMKYSI